MTANVTPLRKKPGKSRRHPAAESRLEAALARVADGVITTDGDNRIEYMNCAAVTLTGWRLDAALGQPLAHVFAIVHAGTGEAVDRALDAAKATDAEATDASRAVLVGVRGSPVLIEYQVAAHRDSHGIVTGSIVIFRDLTRRRQAEVARQTTEATLLANAQTLFEEKQRAQVTLNSIGDAVISTDFRGRIIFLNNVAEEMTQWPQAEACGKHLDVVFFLVDIVSREHVACPAMTAIIEDRRVGLPKTCVLIRRDGSEMAVDGAASPIHDIEGGVAGAVMVAHDVTESRDLSARLARQALYDNLTDLPNRTLFHDRLNQALVSARRNVHSAAVLFVDLDHFKPVNDKLGHAVGDQLLRFVAQTLAGCVRRSDTVSRFGGDEFVILLAEISRSEDAERSAEKIKRAFERPLMVDGNSIGVSTSIGIATFPCSGTDGETLLKHADLAMYHAKRAGRNGFASFDPGMLSADSDAVLSGG